MARLFTRIILLVSLLAVGGLSAGVDVSRAADQKPPRLESKLASDSTIFTLKLDPKTKIVAGKTFDVKIHIAAAKHWHVWSSTMTEDGGLVPLAFMVPAELAEYLEISGKIRESGQIASKYDSNFEVTTKAHYDPFDATVTLMAKKQGKGIPLSLYVHYQTCNESVCMPPRTFVIPMTVLGLKAIPISIEKGNGASLETDSAALPTATILHNDTVQPPAVAKIAPVTDEKTPIIKDKADIIAIADDSIWKFLLAAAGFGLLALLTPCVFPMVPITVSFFTKRNAGSKKEALKDASLYAGGIIVTFVALGFLLSAIAGPAGINRFAANPWANLLIAGIFVMFALNLFGLFEIGVPSSILSSLNSTAQKSKSRTVSVVLMGLVFSLTSFTCTVPFVGTLMVAFSRGSWFVPLIGMAVFAMVFALPFFLLALFPSLMKSMPRSGGWLNSVKVVMGFLEIAAALKFFSNVDLIWSWHFFSRDVVLASWIAIAVVATMYLLGRFRLSHDTPVEHLGAVRVLIAVVFLSAAVHLYSGIHGRPLGQLDAFLPPTDEADVAMYQQSPQGAGFVPTPVKTVEWYPSYTEALKAAKKEGKNIFIDFTGYTCTNCRSMEATVFSRPEIKQMLSNYVLARLYTDNGTPLNDSNRTLEEARFNTIALPFYVIVSPDDKPLGTFPGFTRDIESFKSFLKMPGATSQPSVAMIGR